jgi:alpha-ketoglutaric semialdehyde dehydrogenase
MSYKANFIKYPIKIYHWINDNDDKGGEQHFFPKFNQATGRVAGEVLAGNADDVKRVLDTAQNAYESWSKTPVIMRAELLRKTVLLLQSKCDEIAPIVAMESGRSVKDALGEVSAAVECGMFFEGEGKRYYGKTLTSGIENRFSYLTRQSIGVGALFTPLNNPLANVAWKVFPALLCGNTVVLKAHEDTPYVPVWFGKLLKEAGIPAGVYSVIQGKGAEVGELLLIDKRIKFVSFTGSLATGQKILHATADRLVKVAIEAGGKNPFVVCDDADLEKASQLAVMSAFVDAGQRCASASRIIVFDSVYDEFKNLFLERVRNMKIGVSDSDDMGAVVNERRMNEILKAIDEGKQRGGSIISGGIRLLDKDHKDGFFIAPTVIENVPKDDNLSLQELFGPVTVLYRVKDFDEAVNLSNMSEYKLSGAIHTQNIAKAQQFIRKYKAGVVRVNGPTHGSEAHMPFGGVGLSGNGWREPGQFALDFYSDWKQVTIEY